MWLLRLTTEKRSRWRKDAVKKIMNKWEDNVRKVVPYVPGEQPKQKNIIKLNTNECPYLPAPGITEALKQYDAGMLRRYPDPECGRLTERLAEEYGLSKENVFVGVGSDDVLAIAFMTFFNSSEKILFPDITYSFYDVWANLYGIPYETQPLDENFHLVKEDYMKKNGGIIFPNPNAPTGLEENLSDIEEIIANNRDVVVIVDEAYVDFGGHSVLPLIKKYDNLLVVQTFSKSRALAGIRIGFAMGNEKLIHYMNDVKFSFNSYTINRITEVVGCACLEDRKYFEDTVKKVIATREWTKKELSRLGFTFGDSKANFIFATHRERKAKDIFEALKKAGIFVRYFDKPRIDNYLRISIGTDEEMRKLTDFLEEYLKN